MLLDGISRRADGMIAPKLTMCTFQETYDRRTYGKFMGRDPENPRSDYERRLTNFDRARRAGFRVANPGVLLGLSADVAFEMVASTLHVEHLLQSGMEVYLSTPRLRRIAGRGTEGKVTGRGVDDDDFVRLLALLSLALPDAEARAHDPRAARDPAARREARERPLRRLVGGDPVHRGRRPLPARSEPVRSDRPAPLRNDPARAPRRGVAIENFQPS